MKWGEIWLINLDPSVGAEIRKTRPAVIVNDDELGILPLRVIVPLTDWKDKFTSAPWMVRINPNNLITLKNPHQQIVYKFARFPKKDLSEKSENLVKMKCSRLRNHYL